MVVLWFCLVSYIIVTELRLWNLHFRVLRLQGK